MIFIICFLLLLIFIVFIYLEFCTSPSEPLHKYYEIRNESVYAKMDIPEFTDLGVISVHGDGVTRSKDVVNNTIHYTENNLKITLKIDTFRDFFRDRYCSNLKVSHKKYYISSMLKLSLKSFEQI